MFHLAQELVESRFAALLGSEAARDLAAKAERFFSVPRDPDALARLFATFRVGEHHAVITIGAWLREPAQFEVKEGFARLVWDEALHTKIWTQRMAELIGEQQVDRHYADPRHVPIQQPEYFRLWDEYARADSLAKRLAYIYMVDAWAGFAYTAYLRFVDPVTKWFLQTILADERFHVSFGEAMARKYVESPQEREALTREEHKIARILANVTDGFLSSGI